MKNPIIKKKCSLRCPEHCILCLLSPNWRAIVKTPSPCGDTRGPDAQKPLTSIEIAGPELWNELHKLALEVDLGRPIFLNFLDHFTRRVPCGECRNFTRGYLAEYPPIFGGKFFKWTVDFHNAVNIKLNRVKMPLLVARAIYSTSTP